MKFDYSQFLNGLNSSLYDIKSIDLNQKWWYHNCRVHFAGTIKKAKIIDFEKIKYLVECLLFISLLLIALMMQIALSLAVALLPCALICFWLSNRSMFRIFFPPFVFRLSDLLVLLTSLFMVATSLEITQTLSSFATNPTTCGLEKAIPSVARTAPKPSAAALSSALSVSKEELQPIAKELVISESNSSGPLTSKLAPPALTPATASSSLLNGTSEELSSQRAKKNPLMYVPIQHSQKYCAGETIERVFNLRTKSNFTTINSVSQQLLPNTEYLKSSVLVDNSIVNKVHFFRVPQPEALQIFKANKYLHMKNTGTFSEVFNVRWMDQCVNASERHINVGIFPPNHNTFMFAMLTSDKFYSAAVLNTDINIRGQAKAQYITPCIKVSGDYNILELSCKQTENTIRQFLYDNRNNFTTFFYNKPTAELTVIFHCKSTEYAFEFQLNLFVDTVVKNSISFQDKQGLIQILEHDNFDIVKSVLIKIINGL